jgi:hypothetical protein
VCSADLGSELSHVVSNYQFALSDSNNGIAADVTDCCAESDKKVTMKYIGFNQLSK